MIGTLPPEVGHTIAKYIKGEAYLGLFGNDETSKHLEHIVIEHALLASGAAFIPVPGADVAAIVAIIWVMYARINDALGISLTENVLKSIASGVVANVVSVIPSVALAIAAEVVLKFFPGLGTAGGVAVGVAANVILLYVAGMVYIQSIKVLAKSGKPITEANLKVSIDQISKDKEFIKATSKKGEEVAKDRVH
jgi:uncharacterized protein (DUF697 family)